MDYENLTKEELAAIITKASNALVIKNKADEAVKIVKIKDANTRLSEISNQLDNLFREVETIVSQFDEGDYVTFYFSTPNGSSIEYSPNGGWYSSYD